jgi:MerR family transcriptional regulator/heat shock protein HspR
MKKLLSELTEEEKKDKPLYPIGVVADLIGITNQTIRLYEKHGLIKPARKNRNRLYSDNDLKWLQCLRDIIHKKKISIEGIKMLLYYAPCWEITGCSEKEWDQCSAYIERVKPCWELNRTIRRKGSPEACDNCIVFLSKTKEKC